MILVRLKMVVKTVVKTAAAAIAALLFVGVVACGTAATPTSPAEPPRPLAEVVGPLTIAVEGEGDDLIGPFFVQKGVLVIFINHTGDGDFAVEFVDEEGKEEPFLTSSGPYSGDRLEAVYEDNAGGLVPGVHSIKVSSEGPWRIRLLQELPGSGARLPIEFGGVGDGGGGWAGLSEGSFTLRANHAGESDFKVVLLDAIGSPEVVVIDETGAFDDEVSVTVTKDASVQGPAPGVYAIGVQADGIWSLSLAGADAPSP